MSDSMFRQAWQETIASDPLQDVPAEASARRQHQLHQLRYVLTAFTFAIAGVHLALAVATVLQGEFAALRLAGAAPALAATFLSVHAIRRHSLPLCAAALALLWPGPQSSPSCSGPVAGPSCVERATCLLLPPD